MRTAVLLLAAGGSRRMGEPKLLLPWGKETVVGAALRAAVAAPVAEVVVVTGHEAPLVEAACRTVLAAVTGPLPTVRFVSNPHWSEGMLTSIQAGLAALPAGFKGFFVALGDMPAITPSVYARLIEAQAESPEAICVPVWQGQPGHPVLLPWSLAAESLSVAPADEGLRSIVKLHRERVQELPVACAGVRIDLDTPEEYSRHAPGQAQADVDSGEHVF